MKSLEVEWKELSKNLTPQQASDGRRCFCCGVLLAISEILKSKGQLQAEYIVMRESEIRRILELHVLPNPEPEKGA